MEIHFRIIGILLIVLALMHVGFPSYFKWKEELPKLSMMNREMMYYHSFFIALTLLLMGLMLLLYTEQLLHESLGRGICFGLALFWSLRLFIQFFGYSSKLWKGKKFETIVHVIFSLFWLYLSGTFSCAFYFHSSI